MASGGQSGYGMVLAGASTGTIVDITSITHPSIEVTVIDVTTMDSTNGWREKISGLKDAGEIAVDVWYTTAQMTTLLTAFASAEEVWTITFPDTGETLATGFISGIGGTSPMDDGITQTLTITLTGEPTHS